MIIKENLKSVVKRTVILDFLENHSWQETCKKFKISVATISRLKKGQEETIINYKRKTVFRDTDFEIDVHLEMIRKTTYYITQEYKLNKYAKEDIFQDTCLEIILKSKIFLEHKKPVNFIARIARGKVREMFQKKLAI